MSTPAGVEPAPPETPSAEFDALERSAIAGAVFLGLAGALTLVTAMLTIRTDFVSNGSLVLAIIGAAAITVQSFRAVALRRLLWPSAYVIIAVAFIVLMGARPSQNTNIDRDPAVYNTTARTLADAPSLFVHADDGPFESSSDLRFGTAGLYDVRGDGELEFQFNHLSPALGAAFYDVGGHRALFRLPALLTGIGLLAVGLVSRRLTQSTAAGLLAMTVLGATLPIIAIGRDSYSEPAAFAFLWLALVAHARATTGSSARAGLVTGVLLGFAVMSRADSLAYLAVLAIALSADLLMHPQRAERLRRVAAQTFVGALPGVAIALIDLRYFTGNYASDLSEQTRPLYQAVVLSLTILLVVAVGSRVANWPSRLIITALPGLRVAVPVIVVAALLAGWLVRPHLGEVRLDATNTYLERIQTNEGVAADGSRTYAEQSLVWMSWYLGPITLGMAVLGVGLAARRALLIRTSSSLLTTTLALFVVMGSIYFWRPSITPDHIWAMRRYAPVLIPCLVIAAVGAVVALAARIPTTSTRRTLGVVGIGLLFFGSTMRTTLPAIDHRTQFGSVAVLDQLCDAIGPNAAVVFPEYEGNASAVRAWCGIPVAIALESLTPDALIALSRAWEAEGVQLYLVARNEDVINRYYPGLPTEQFTTETLVNNRWLERSTESAPDGYVTQTMRLVGQAVPTAARP